MRTPYFLLLTYKCCTEMGRLDKSAKGLEESAGKSVKAKVGKTDPDASTEKNAKQITEWLSAANGRLDAGR